MTSLGFATDELYNAPGKDWDGTPTKVPPGTPAQGNQPESGAGAQHINYLINNLDQRIDERPWVNIEAFGATHANTDNSTELQAVINYAIANKYSVFVPAGNWYRFTSDLTINDDLNFFGRGQIGNDAGKITCNRDVIFEGITVACRLVRGQGLLHFHRCYFAGLVENQGLNAEDRDTVLFDTCKLIKANTNEFYTDSACVDNSYLIIKDCEHTSYAAGSKIAIADRVVIKGLKGRAHDSLIQTPHFRDYYYDIRGVDIVNSDNDQANAPILDLAGLSAGSGFFSEGDNYCSANSSATSDSRRLFTPQAGGATLPVNWAGNDIVHLGSRESANARAVVDTTPTLPSDYEAPIDPIECRYWQVTILPGSGSEWTIVDVNNTAILGAELIVHVNYSSAATMSGDCRFSANFKDVDGGALFMTSNANWPINQPRIFYFRGVVSATNNLVWQLVHRPIP